MGCGCKNDDSIFTSGDTIDKKAYLTNKIGKFLYRRGKFSIIGVLLYLILLPIITLFVLPIITIILFNRIVMGKETNLINLIAFSKVKKSKKIKK